MIQTLLTSTLVRRFLLLLLPLAVIQRAISFASSQGHQRKALTDFDAFYIAGQMVWRGDIADAYSFTAMMQAQRSFSGADGFLPWTYPPPFNLIVALLAGLPEALAYLAFTSLTLILFLIILYRIAGSTFSLVLLAIYPAILVTISCGQNGFLTASLIGLCALGLKRDSLASGIPLGLLIIKPHLAVAFAFYVIVTKRWGCTSVAAFTAGLACLLATVAFGLPIWQAFLAGVSEAKSFLIAGYYPLHRMISLYAVIRSFDVSADLAMAAQAILALFALSTTVFAIRRRLPTTRMLGFVSLASLLISPYAYDYDLTIYGIALALLMPDFVRLARNHQQLILVGLSLFVCSFGLVTSMILNGGEKSNQINSSLNLGGDDVLPTIAGLGLLAAGILLWRVLGHDPTPASTEPADQSPASMTSESAAGPADLGILVPDSRGF